MTRHLVVGAGPAGVTACETLRRLDPHASITLLAGESGDPYARMAIPYLLTGAVDEQGTRLRREADFYERQGIELRHDRLVAVDPAVGTARLEVGGTLPFDRLLLATGATPLKPPVPGIDLPGVESCWSLEDARAIAGRAVDGSRVVLIGAGFIGCIILESLVRCGVRLTVVERGARMVPRMLDESAGGLLRRWCEEKGIRVLTDHTVTAIETDRDALRVVLGSGERLPADLVITATGVRSNIDFLEGSGIETGQGVVVDETLCTSHPAVYAAGDVAEGPDLGGGRAVHAIQPTATEHGRVAAHNMVRAGSVRYHGSLNMNVLDTLGLISASFGRWEGGEETVVLHDPEGRRYMRLAFEGDRLVGAILVGHTDHVGAVRGLIESGCPLGGWMERLRRDPTRIAEAYLATTRAVA